jgi:hypothetical protein
MRQKFLLSKNKNKGELRIRGLYTLVEDDSIELFFDDMDLVSVEQNLDH